MTIDQVIFEVKALRDAMKKIITEGSSHVFSAVLADLEKQREDNNKISRKKARPPWRLVITPQAPLSFKCTSDEPNVNHHLEVDLACKLTQPDSAGIPRGEHNISVRIWAVTPDLFFRSDLDADTLRDPVVAQGRRVMLRFHFDHANTAQEGPKHHLQIGGKGMANDYGWLPDNWKLPRFLHFPVNLALACEFIARTFFPSKFAAISAEPTWTHAIRHAEATYLLPFFDKLPYLNLIPAQHKRSLLSTVWND